MKNERKTISSGPTTGLSSKTYVLVNFNTSVLFCFVLFFCNDIVIDHCTQFMKTPKKKGRGGYVLRNCLFKELRIS